MGRMLLRKSLLYVSKLYSLYCQPHARALGSTCQVPSILRRLGLSKWYHVVLVLSG